MASSVCRKIYTAPERGGEPSELNRSPRGGQPQPNTLAACDWIIRLNALDFSAPDIPLPPSRPLKDFL
jgi:hypothetical protein